MKKIIRVMALAMLVFQATPSFADATGNSDNWDCAFYRLDNFRMPDKGGWYVIYAKKGDLVEDLHHVTAWEIECDKIKGCGTKKRSDYDTNDSITSVKVKNGAKAFLYQNTSSSSVSYGAMISINKDEQKFDDDWNDRASALRCKE